MPVVSVCLARHHSPTAEIKLHWLHPQVSPKPVPRVASGKCCHTLSQMLRCFSETRFLTNASADNTLIGSDASSTMSRSVLTKIHVGNLLRTCQTLCHCQGQWPRLGETNIRPQFFQISRLSHYTRLLSLSRTLDLGVAERKLIAKLCREEVLRDLCMKSSWCNNTTRHFQVARMIFEDTFL